MKERAFGKKNWILILIAGLLVAAAVLICIVQQQGGFSMLFQKIRHPKPVEITSVESFTLRISGMRVTEKYELTAGEDGITLSLYWMDYSTPEDRWLLQNAVTRPTAEILELLNDCELSAWDGFHGKHPKGVLDGRMFTLEAAVNGGTTIRADGSENFPAHFSELEQRFNELLRG